MSQMLGMWQGGGALSLVSIAYIHILHIDSLRHVGLVASKHIYRISLNSTHTLNSTMVKVVKVGGKKASTCSTFYQLKQPL